MRFSGWRARLTETIFGPRALEAGVGTGKNSPYYPSEVAVTAIDFSRRMLTKSERKAEGRLDGLSFLWMSSISIFGSVAKSLWFLIYAFGNIKQQPRICIDEFEKSIQVASF